MSGLFSIVLSRFSLALLLQSQPLAVSCTLTVLCFLSPHLFSHLFFLFYLSSSHSLLLSQSSALVVARTRSGLLCSAAQDHWLVEDEVAHVWIDFVPHAWWSHSVHVIVCSVVYVCLFSVSPRSDFMPYFRLHHNVVAILGLDGSCILHFALSVSQGYILLYWLSPPMHFF